MTDKINIPFGDGNGFDTQDLPKEEIIEKNYNMVDTIIGVNEDGSHIKPDDEDWKKIDQHLEKKPYDFIPLKQEQFTEVEKNEDFEYYVNNLRANFKNSSMQDVGTIKTIRKENDKTKKVTAITTGIFAICILTAATAYTANDIKTTFPNEALTQSTVDKYIGYKKGIIKQNYEDFLEKLNDKAEFYLAPRSDVTGAKPGETTDPEFYDNQFPYIEFAKGGK